MSNGTSCPWGELSMGEMSWDELSWGEMSWDELSWGEITGQVVKGRVAMGRVVRKSFNRAIVHTIYVLKSQVLRIIVPKKSVYLWV
jgi:hypothetical protein